MSQVALSFPDETYSSSNKPSVLTLKADLTAIETAHNDTDTNAVTATGVATLTNKTLTAPIITTPTIRTWDGWQSVTDSWTYASADAPTFTITVPSGAASLYGVGMRIKLNQTTDKYFIITAVADTVLTVYGGTDYTLANAAISSVYVSPMKAPLGFPLDPTKWTVQLAGQTDRSIALSATTWANIHATFTLTMPIGVWYASYDVDVFADRTTAGTGDSCSVTLSTTTNSETDGKFTSMPGYYGSAVANSSDIIGGHAHRDGVIAASVKTPYYLNGYMQNAGIMYVNAGQAYAGDIVIKFICAYL